MLNFLLGSVGGGEGVRWFVRGGGGGSGGAEGRGGKSGCGADVEGVPRDCGSSADDEGVTASAAAWSEGGDHRPQWKRGEPWAKPRCGGEGDGRGRIQAGGNVRLYQGGWAGLFSDLSGAIKIGRASCRERV